MENAIDTASSMKSRGYGLPGRTAFSIYRFDRRDRRALVFLLLCGGGVMAGAFAGELKFVYMPILSGAAFDLWQAVVFGLYLALCAMPMLINGREDLKWKSMKKQRTAPPSPSKI